MNVITPTVHQTASIVAQAPVGQFSPTFVHEVIKQTEAELRIVTARLAKVQALIDKPDFQVGRLVKADSLREALS